MKRAGNLCLWFFIPKAAQDQGSQIERLREEVERIGGWLDGGLSSLFVFTIPISAGFPLVEHVFDEAAARIPGAEWLYGNVYAPHDGRTPLNWWEEFAQ